MRRVLGSLVALWVTAPAGAQAAPAIDRTATISAAAPNYAWDGQQAQAAAPQQSADGFDPYLCSKEPGYYCDVTHVRLDAAADSTATLQFDIFDFSVAVADFDLSIFRSDAAGQPGEFIANGGNLSAAGLEETVIVRDAEPGYYLATVSYYFSPNASYKGTIKGSDITPAPTPAPTPVATTSPTPAPVSSGRLRLKLPSRLGSARRAARGRSLRVRVNAAEELTDVVLRLTDSRRRLVASARVARLPAGSREIGLKLRRRPRAGRYTLTATAGGRSVKRAARLSR